MVDVKPTKETDDSLSLAVITDSHFRAEPDALSTMHGPKYVLRERAEAIFAHLQAADVKVDMAIHNGDIVDRGEVGSYHEYDSLVQATLPNIPTYYNVGNHDVGKAMIDFLKFGIRDSMRPQATTQCYSVQHGIHSFFMLDGTIEGDIKFARISDETLEWLDASLEALPDTQPAWIFTHYPAFKQDPQLPTAWALKNGSALHGVLQTHFKKVGGVFTGHVHNTYETTHLDSIPYVSLAPASTALRASESGSEHDPSGLVGYHLLKLKEDGTFDLKRVAVPFAQEEELKAT